MSEIEELYEVLEEAREADQVASACVIYEEILTQEDVENVKVEHNTYNMNIWLQIFGYFANYGKLTNTFSIEFDIKNITFNINKFIELWEKRIWSDKAAPALHLGHPSLPHKLTYEYVCESFMSLTTMLENRLVTRLSADILNYFLNGSLRTIYHL